MVRIKIAAILLSTLSATALAETVTGYFVAPMYGASFGGKLETSDVEASGERDTVGKLKLDNDGHYGLMLGMELARPGNVYFLYTKQETSFKEGDFAPSNGVDVDLSYYHFGGSLYFPNGDFTPYVTASIGGTEIKPSGDYSSEWAFSFGIGLGVNYDITDNFGLYADVRGYFSGYEQSSDLVCPEDNDNCVIRIENDALIQTQANLGFVVRF